MNLFGAFNFGRLIKTFLPGLILFIGLLFYIDILLYYLIGHPKVVPYFLQKDLQFLTLSIPSSIILGIFSNTLFFSEAMDRLIEIPNKKKRPAFYRYEESLKQKINEYYIDRLNLTDEEQDGFRQFNDPRHFLLHKQDLEKYMFIQESYWYYLEFQINILLALIFITPALLVSLLLAHRVGYLGYLSMTLLMIFSIVLLYVLAKLLLQGAVLNFEKFRSKYLSLLLGTFYSWVQDDKEAEKS
jgi:hypothetical protein